MSTYTLISAMVGDTLSAEGAVDLAIADDPKNGIIGCDELQSLMGLPQVRQFFAENGYGEDEDEVMYLAPGEHESGRYDTLTVTLTPADVPADVRLVNCTPHPITVCGITIPPSGITPRLPETTNQVGALRLNGVDIPVVETEYGQSAELPEPQPDTYLVVPAKIALAYPHRTDLLMPGTPVRDDQGRVVGVTTLARAPRNT